MLQSSKIWNIITHLLFLVLMVHLCSCDGKVHVSTAEEIKNQIDSAAFRQDMISYNKGKQLFIRYCNTCHYAPEKHVLDQYVFDNLFERLPSPAEAYFVSYISDSKPLKATGNQYAKQVDETWQQDYEHKFKDSLSSNDLHNLISYIKIAAKQRYQNKGG